MSSTPFTFRRRTIGRAASPPTWACYEQIPYDHDEGYSDSGSESCSEDDEEYHHHRQDHNESSDDDEESHNDDDHTNGMDIDLEGDNSAPPKDNKGKQRAVDPEPEAETASLPAKQHNRRKERQPAVFTLRPILTIQKSQGFVWNQDLFVPPYIKDRYVASTSPPSNMGLSSSSSSTTSTLGEYSNFEIEVVEIRVREGDLDDIIP